MNDFLLIIPRHPHRSSTRLSLHHSHEPSSLSPPNPTHQAASTTYSKPKQLRLSKHHLYHRTHTIRIPCPSRPPHTGHHQPRLHLPSPISPSPISHLPYTFSNHSIHSTPFNPPLHPPPITLPHHPPLLTHFPSHHAQTPNKKTPNYSSSMTPSLVRGRIEGEERKGRVNAEGERRESRDLKENEGVEAMQGMKEGGD